MNIGNMTVFVSSYAGQSNVGEQKAELGVDVQSDSYTVMMNEWLPLIHAQFKREMSRLADYRPAYVGFFIAMSEHTNNPRKDADDQDYFIQLCFTPRKGG
jgi:hypothetical protein